MTPTDAVSPALFELAEACGVATSYEDARGIRRDISTRTLRAVLAAMGVGSPGIERDAGDDGKPEKDNDNDDDTVAAADRVALDEFRLRPWRRALPPTVVARRGTSTSFAVHVPRGATASCFVHLEHVAVPVHLPMTGAPTDSRRIDGVVIDRFKVEIPDSVLPGWHRLVAVVADTPVEATLLVSPQSIPVPADLQLRSAVGLAAQLYQVRSDSSWGVGDLADLAELAGWAGRDLNADFVLVNPMHADQPYPPVEPSPYLPTTRRFASTLYLRPERVEEYAALSTEDRSRVDELARSQRKTNSEDTIDRDTSWSAKLEALRIIFSAPLSVGRAEEFETFVANQGSGLQRFATWCALSAEHGPDWSHWPAELQNPEAIEVADFAKTHHGEIRFHLWLQWVVTQQRAIAQRDALAAGMRLGILHDLAVGVHPTGADAWALHQSLARGVSVGAPPDVYNQRGQDWSQPPLRPDALAEQGYLPFRDIVRAALRDSGGVRIDHILGLFRLWWIPSGLAPTEGTYVRYDQEAMIGVLALEAWRAGAVVIGEDLGTVEPGVREQLSDRGILGTSVLWFEQEDNRPLPPRDYRRLCMASVTTHDLPPSAGYVDLAHVDIRADLGQLTRTVEDERRDAAEEIESYVGALRDRGLLETNNPEAVVVALHQFLAEAPSLLYAVSVADLVGDRRPVNMPGTSDEYPNWRVPLSDSNGDLVSLEDLRESQLAHRVMSAAHGCPD